MAEEILFYVWKNLILKLSFVSFDAFYGRDLSLLQRLNKSSITFMADIPEKQSMYLNSFDIVVPKKNQWQGVLQLMQSLIHLRLG